MADVYTQAALDYAESVLSEEILACSYVKQACQRFFDDLQRMDVHYDQKAVRKCGLFMEQLSNVSGRWRGQKLKLSPYQCFVVANLIGLKYVASGLRKYREAYIEVPRKNGKSTFAAAFCLNFLAMDGEPGAEVYCAATNEKQALKVFGPACQMLKDDEELREYLDVEVLAKSIFNDRENIVFQPVIGDPPDGDSPSFAVVDEYHEHPHDRAYKTFQTGQGARLQPLLMVITTAGDNIDGPCHRKRDEAVQILAGTLRDVHSDRMFGLIYTIEGDKDFWRTEDALWMANPNIGHSTDIQYLREQQAQALRSRHEQSGFQTKHLDVWIGQSDPWIDMNAWNQNGYDMHVLDEDGEEIVAPDDPRIFEKFIDLPCAIAVDLSARNDFTAAVVLFYEDEPLGAGETAPPDPVPVKEGEEDVADRPWRKKNTRRVYWAFPFFWLPRSTFDKVQLYHAWEKYITVHDGEEIDLLKVAGTIRDWLDGGEDGKVPPLLAKEFIVDPHRSIGVEQHIAESVVWTEIVRFSQTTGSYSAAMYEIQAAVEAGRFRHPRNPVLDWMMGNLPYKKTDDNEVKPKRPKNVNKKIDGAVCCVMGAGRAMTYEDEGPPALGSMKM